MIFKGTVQYQSQAGETVTIKVTKPDGTIDTFTATTLADRTYSTTRTYTDAGQYSATASIGEDAGYLAATSTPPTLFTVTKTARTITLVVDIA